MKQLFAGLLSALTVTACGTLNGMPMLGAINGVVQGMNEGRQQAAAQAVVPTEPSGSPAGPSAGARDAAGSGALYIFGGEGHNTFLGCLNCGSTHPKSVWNEMSHFGFKNDFGVWNSFGQFSSKFSSFSMCNQYATDPPVIVDDQGNAYGRITGNAFARGSVCAATGNAQLCQAVHVVCESKS